MRASTSCPINDCRLGAFMAGHQTLPQFVELRHDPDHEVLKLVKGLNYGFRFRRTELIKRYLGDNLSVALELLLKIDGCASRYSALIAKGPLHHFHRELDCWRANHDHEFSVLVDNVKIVNDERQRVDVAPDAVIWLKLFDKSTDYRLSDSLYFSFVTGKNIFLRWPRLKDGKLDPFPVCLSVGGFGKLPNDVVEDRPKMVDDFPGQQREAQRDRTIPMILDCLRKNLSVLIAEDGVLAFLKKPVDLNLKITDVLLGPI